MQNKRSDPITYQDYSKILQATNHIQYGAVKGTLFFTPKTFWIWTQIQRFLDQRFAELGVENVFFPSFITKAALAQEKAHVAGFQPEVLEVTHAGGKPLTNSFYLRPTSEVLFAQYFQKALKSYRDLPLLLNQWVNVWRWEQNPKPFFRNIEFLWQEGHTLHPTAATASDFGQKIYQIYLQLLNEFLLIPTFKGFKSDLEKFAGACRTWALETLTPDGQFLQLATVHELGQAFSQAFKVQFLALDNQLQYPFQTSWGVSTRLIAGLIATHLDHTGLKFPFDLAKTQVIVYVFTTSSFQPATLTALLKYSQEVISKLIALGYRVVKLDLAQTKKSVSFWHRHYWQAGVPLQITLGQVELSEKLISYAWRTTHSKQQTESVDSFIANLPTAIQTYNQQLWTVAKQRLNQAVMPVTDYAAYRAIPVKNAAYQVAFCGKSACEKVIKQSTGTVSRVLAGLDATLPVKAVCFHCQTPTKLKALFGRSY